MRRVDQADQRRAPDFGARPRDVPIPSLRPWEPTAGDHVLYRLYCANGFLLYIGVTSNWRARMRGHWSHEGIRPGGATVQVFRTRAEAERAEADAIRTERPPLNEAAGTGRFG